MSGNTVWIHCNLCFHLFNSKDRRFFVFSCEYHHILCLCCMKHTNEGHRCPICRTRIKYMELSEQNVSDVHFNIRARQDLLEDYTDIVEFQNRQIDELLSYKQKKIEKADKWVAAKPQELEYKIGKREKARQYRKQLQAKLKEMLEHERSSGYNSTRGSRSSFGMAFENSALADEVSGMSRASLGNLFSR